MLDDIPLAIDNAKQAKLSIIIANGLDLPTNKGVMQLAKDFDIVKPALGAYPVMDGHVPDDLQLTQNITFIKKNKDKIIALGEVGLDFKESDEKEQQIKNFKRIISLGKELNLPLIIHTRKAESDVIKILKEEKAKKVVLHCFSGKKALIKEGVDAGFYFTVPTNVVRSRQFQELIKIVPLSKLFCETDSPYLSPFKDKQNEPSFVLESYKMIAKIKGVTLEETIKNIYMNYKKLFD